MLIVLKMMYFQNHETAAFEEVLEIKIIFTAQTWWKTLRELFQNSSGEFYTLVVASL